MTTKNKLIKLEKEMLAKEFLQKGEQEEKKKNYKDGLKYYQQAAKLGNSEAIKNIGNFYKDGKSVDANYKFAMKYFKRAAKLGNVEAIKNIGCMYFDGSGVKRDIKKAKEWFKRAIALGGGVEFKKIVEKYNYPNEENEYNEVITILKNLANNGNVDAMFNLALVYDNMAFGDMEERNKAKIEYYKKAAEAGHPKAMYEFSETGGKLNIKWCKKAAEAGCVEAMIRLSHAEDNKKEKLKWLERAAEIGDAFDKQDIGNAYVDCKEYDKALEMYIMATSEGADCLEEISDLYNNYGSEIDKKVKECYQKFNAKEIFQKNRDIKKLGDMYFYGIGVEQDYLTALYYYQEAYFGGDYEILLKIGDMYYYGYGVKQSCVEARKYYEKALDCVDSRFSPARHAFSKIGNLMYFDKKIFNNYNEAIEYHKKTAEKGNADAMFYLGCLDMYEGYGSYSEAMEWFMKAAELGCTKAMIIIGDYVNNSKEWYSKAAKLHDTEGIYKLGLEKIKFPESDVEAKEGYKLCKLALKLGYAKAADAIRLYYSRRNKYSNKSYENRMELKYSKIGAEMGDCYAINYLISLYKLYNRNDIEGDEWFHAGEIRII